MKKLFSIFIVYMLLLGGLSAAAVKMDNLTNQDNESTVVTTVNFSSVKIMNGKNDYVRLLIKDEPLYIMNPGQPMIPRTLKIFEFPFGIQNVNVNVIPRNIHEQQLTKEIEPAPAPVSLSPQKEPIDFPKKDMTIYTSQELFPPAWYSYNVGCGLNAEGKHVTYVTVHLYPIRYEPAAEKIYVAENAEITITFDPPSTEFFPQTSEYDLVIIAPSVFADSLQPLVDHKNSFGVSTLLKTTEDIYAEYSGVDKPEQIKYFIKDAVETLGVQYVLLVGGLKSIIYAKPRDHKNYGASGWHVPVRYSNLFSGEPGYLCDLYYADLYKEGGEFENWDSNGNGIFAEWTSEQGQPEDVLDLYPDVAVGRLACRNTHEVEDIVNKIIKYETTTYGSEWFNRIMAVSGDGFLDQQDLNIQWDTNGLPEGAYTIYGQSSNPDGDVGPVDVIHVTLDRTKETNLTFNHDDHLNPAVQNGYPAPPIAEIVSVSEGNLLGNTDYTYEPTHWEAYCNDLFWWANVSYINGVLTIRGKSYDPKPYGNLTDIHVWVENDAGEVVFSAWRNNTEMYYEGEWVTGEKQLNGRGGALYYMPAEFDKVLVWTSNGEFGDMEDVIEAFNQGFGFAFFSGHGSPGWWGDHTPGIPGNRMHAQVAGLVVSQVSPFFPFITPPAFPMNTLSNSGKFPVVVVGGCHNSMFNISLIPSVLDLFYLIYFGKNIWMHTYGRPTPECWGWYLVKLPNTGAIATMGNTGYGWGWEGEWCTVGAGDGWITSEFFRQYGEYGYDILGTAYSQTITSYISTFKEFTLPDCWWSPDFGWDWVDEKTVQQWVLLGDPSLKIGGYP